MDHLADISDESENTGFYASQSCGGYQKYQGDSNLIVLSLPGFSNTVISIRVPAENRWHTHIE